MAAPAAFQDAQIKQFDAVHVAFIHFKIPRADMPKVFAPALQEIFALLGELHVAPAGAVTAHHLALDEATFDFNLCVPIREPLAKLSGRVQTGTLPAVRAAYAVHVGPYDGPNGLHHAWDEFSKWIKAQGLKTQSHIWEAYPHGPDKEADSNQYRTELVAPLV